MQAWAHAPAGQVSPFPHTMHVVPQWFGSLPQETQVLAAPQYCPVGHWLLAVHCTHMLLLQWGVPAAHWLSIVHCTHTLLLQNGAAIAQSPLTWHCTQAVPVHTGVPPPHTAQAAPQWLGSAPQATQVLFVAQYWPIPHWALVVHCTQALPLQ
jgi:hypothetical protein